MTLLSRVLGRRAILCPRSGLILDDYADSAFMRGIIKRVCRASSYVVCQGQKWKEFYSRVSGLPDDRLPVINNCIKAKAYEQVTPLAGHESVTVLFLGWLERNKGIFDLLDAFNIYRHELGGARLVICGDGSQRETLRVKVRDLGLGDQVDFRGWVIGHEKLRAIDECDLLVLPSQREGFPNVLLEAMSAGRPVIASAVGAVPELVEPEATGLLCEPGNVQDLGLKLVRLCNDLDLRTRLGEAGRSRILASYDIDKLWTKWMELLAARNAF